MQTLPRMLLLKVGEIKGMVCWITYTHITELVNKIIDGPWNLYIFQINHKYMERRLLVAEACGALAAYLPVSCFISNLSY